MSCLAVVATVFLASGCAQLDVKDSLPSMPWSKDDDEPQVPSRLIAVWVDTVRYTEGTRPVRGFGGRLMFYNEDDEEPVKVEGDLVVYAFDEDSQKPGDPRPTRKYVFRSDQLPIHYSESKLGHSYNFFLPWDEVGGLQKQLSLIVRFQPKRGPVVVSEITHHILPGRTPPEKNEFAEPERGGDVQPASFSSRAQRVPRRSMKTATIELPARAGSQVPTASVRSRLTRMTVRPAARASQEPRPTQEAPTEPEADSPPSRFHPRATPIARRDHGRER